VPCSPCYLRRLSQCPHSHVCIEKVSASSVIEKVDAAFGGARRG
jgi:hypothetical protein